MHVHIQPVQICFQLIGLCLFLVSVSAQPAGLEKPGSCPPPFPLARFYIEPQPDSPIVIRDFKAELVQNPGDVMAFNRIRVLFYFENRSRKKIKTYLWDEPAPNESQWPSGGIASVDLLPGESHRSKNTFHTQKGPSIVFRMTEVEFEDGTRWKARSYNKANALKTAPICVTREKWPLNREKRAMDADQWTSPIFADRIIKTIDGEQLSIEGVTVETKLFEIDRERLDSIRTCRPDDILGVDNRRAIDFDIEKYRTFSVRDRIFAYLIHYEFVDEKGQFEIGAGSGSFFVDMNGTGKFSLQCDDGNVVPSIPAWVKRSR